jgi:predicted NUDIX family NTP pyrophosphohydrolase
VKRSAGLLLWRRSSAGPDGVIEVLWAHPGGPFFAKKDDAHWTIPKGELEGVEDEWTAAQREFSEELGIAVPPGTPLSLGEAKQGSKTNVIWALEGDPGPFEVKSNLFEMEWPPRSGRTAEFVEVDRAEWFSLEMAEAKLFVSQRVFLTRLQDAVGSR